MQLGLLIGSQIQAIKENKNWYLLYYNVESIENYKIIKQKKLHEEQNKKDRNIEEKL